MKKRKFVSEEPDKDSTKVVTSTIMPTPAVSDKSIITENIPTKELPESSGKEVYYTDTMNEYRRLGIRQENELTWLGKFCHQLTDNYLDHCVFVPKDTIQYSSDEGMNYQTALSHEERILAGEKITLDSDDKLDLNQDGRKEMIHFTHTSSRVDDYGLLYTLKVDNSVVTYEGVYVDSTILAVSWIKKRYN